MPLKRFSQLLLVVGAVLGLAKAASGQSILSNVTPSFRPGPYTCISINPNDGSQVAIGTADGHILYSGDGGLTSNDIYAVAARGYAILPMRPNPQRHIELQRQLYAGELASAASGRGSGSPRLFIQNMRNGVPVAKWAIWMGIDDLYVEISDVALPGGDGPMLLAGVQGIYMSDWRKSYFTRVLGIPRPKGQDVIGFAVAVNPTDSSHMLVSTSLGFFVSHNGGKTFMPHKDHRLAGEQVKQFIWSPADPKRIFAVTPEAVLESSDAGKTFNAVLGSEDQINTVAISDQGAYIATGKGLTIARGEGKEEKRFRNDSVVGVVPLGEGYALAATPDTLYLTSSTGSRALMRTTPRDPILRLVGTPTLTWLLTKYGVFRIGPQELRAAKRRPAPRLLLTGEELERIVLKRHKLGNPDETRLHLRWYAMLLPTLSVRIQGIVENDYKVTYDSTFPIRYFNYSVGRNSYCCGGIPGQPPEDFLVFAHWDLGHILLGEDSHVANPFGFLEEGVRAAREELVTQTGWRYRDLAMMARMLERPPEDPETEFYWRMRFEEQASYLEAMSGRQVVERPSYLEEIP